MKTKKTTNILTDEEFCHYSGLPSVTYYDNIQKQKVMQEKESKTNWHFRISLVKSVLRIGAGAAFILGGIVLGGVLLIGAEILGILEEL
jgi:hypothetical protein